MITKKRVLFLCVHNSCRSQMAEGLLKHFADDRFETFSAGNKPTEVNPFTIKVMKEIGIDITDHYSKSVNEFLGQSFDYVINVCDDAKESCPVFPGAAKKLHWSFEDPASDERSEIEKLQLFRRVRDEISFKIKEFIEKAA